MGESRYGVYFEEWHENVFIGCVAESGMARISIADAKELYVLGRIELEDFERYGDAVGWEAQAPADS